METSNTVDVFPHGAFVGIDTHRHLAHSSIGRPMTSLTRILLVDDDHLALRALLRICRGGFDVQTAGSAAEALQVVREHPPQVVISDQIMPGVSGVELLGEIRETTPDVRRILMTASANDLTQQALEQGVAQSVLEKPFDHEELVATIDALLAE